MAKYHNRIMNIKPVYTDSQDMGYEDREEAYKDGHRDARHAAAEIALEAEREIRELEEYAEILRQQLLEELMK